MEGWRDVYLRNPSLISDNSDNGQRNSRRQYQYLDWCILYLKVLIIDVNYFLAQIAKIWRLYDDSDYTNKLSGGPK